MQPDKKLKWMLILGVIALLLIPIAAAFLFPHKDPTSAPLITMLFTAPVIWLLFRGIKKYSIQSRADTLPPKPVPLSSTFDPTVYPRTYRKPLSDRIVYTGLTVAAGYFFIKHFYDAGVPPLFLLIITALPSYSFFSVIFTKIVLYPDRIESIQPFYRQSMPRNDIIGITQIGRYDTPALQGQTSYPVYFILPKTIRKDDAWNQWMEGIPDLNALEEKRIIEDTQSTYQTLGATAEARSAHIKKLISYSTWLFRVSFIAGFLALFKLHFCSYVLMALPWLAYLVLRQYPSALKEHKLISNYGKALMAIILSGIFLGAASITYLPHIPSGAFLRLFGIGSLIGLPLSFLVIADMRRQSPWCMILLVVLLPGTILYGTGIAKQADAALDHSPPASYNASVLMNDHQSAYDAHVTIHLRDTEAKDIVIEAEEPILDWLNVNAPVCYRQYPGFLGIGWYVITRNKCS